MAQISQAALAALWRQLSDPTYGFNAQIEGNYLAYGIRPFTVDFGANFGDGGPAFFYGLISADTYEASDAVQNVNDDLSILQYVLICIDTIAPIRDERTVTYATFAGIVPFVIQITLSFMSSQAPKNLAFWKNAVEDAVYSCLNAPSSQAGWPPGTIYNPKMTLTAPPAQMNSGNFRQVMTFTGQFTRIAA